MIRSWIKQTEGVALMEAVIIFPTMFLMLFGLYDIGHAITANHKVITSANVVADLLTRGQAVSDTELTQAIEAGRLAMSPYVNSNEDYCVDIVSVQFNSDNDPVPLWNENSGTKESCTNATQRQETMEEIVESARGLGTSGEGVMVVSVIYFYEPTFGNIVLNEFRMRETAFARGRRSSTVFRD